MTWSGDYYAHHDDWEVDDDRYSHTDYDYPSYRYQFQTEEELITSFVFQRCLGQALAHKDIEIHRLREELLTEYWRNYDNQRNRV